MGASRPLLTFTILVLAHDDGQSRLNPRSLIYSILLRSTSFKSMGAVSQGGQTSSQTAVFTYSIAYQYLVFG